MDSILNPMHCDYFDGPSLMVQRGPDKRSLTLTLAFATAMGGLVYFYSTHFGKTVPSGGTRPFDPNKPLPPKP